MNFPMKNRNGRNECELQRKHRLHLINREIIRGEKRHRGCELCGRRDLAPHLLNFHHRNGSKKRRKICHMINSATATLIDEIAQCHLWCRWSHNHFHRTGEIKTCPCAFCGRQKGGMIDEP